jgi:hypothetical protein
MITSIFAFAKLANEYIFPSVPVSLKSGAFAPIVSVAGSSLKEERLKEERKIITAATKKKREFHRQTIYQKIRF